MRRLGAVVVGQGVAGTLVSWRLRAAGVAHLVVDRGHGRAASRAAAGIVNPVTGRRFALAWRIGEVVDGLAVYRELETALGMPLLHELEILRDLSAPEALNQWDMRRADPAYAPYMRPPTTRGVHGLDAPWRLGPTAGFRVDLPALLAAFRQNLRGRGELVERDVGIAYGDRGEVHDRSARLRLRLAEGGWLLDGPGCAPRLAARVVDCRGAGSAGGPWAGLPWRGTKGEALRFAAPGLPRDVAVKRRAFACPVGGRGDVWLGATNDDRFDDAEPSPAGRRWLAEQAAGLGLSVPSDAEHLAAVRPTTRTRRPFVREHADLPGLWICGGLGTKGASLAPLCSRELAEAIAP